MNKFEKCCAAACLAAVCIVSSGIVRAEEQEKSAKMKDLPEAVQKTIRDQGKDAKVRGLSIETEDGKISYEAELTVKGHGKDLLLDASGAVLEIEEKVEFSALPAAAQQQLKASAGKGKIRRIEALTKTGELPVYEALVADAGKKSEITVAADGKLISLKELNPGPEEKKAGAKAAKKK